MNLSIGGSIPRVYPEILLGGGKQLINEIKTTS